MGRLFKEISRIVDYILTDDVVNRILYILAIVILFIIAWPRIKAEQDMIDHYNKTHINK